MYPVFRFAWQMWKHRRDPRLSLLETHVSRHRCWPWDLDIWMELNNGRTLTLYDLGRLPMSMRTGMIDVLKEKGWGITMAGASLRYRRRVTVFEMLTMKSRGLGWDDRFFYVEQSMWRADGECTSHALFRSALVGGKGRAGIVPPAELAKALGHDGPSPELPDYVKAWIAADAHRPWPPMQDAPPA
ncbi:acyl-CoA thioesterase [Wenxinia marina]|uniref:Thioesterase-like superfamily n=1 Tax=Wenxinia marina DSM 24838 TaxID=1123501 RepID=A0A0D0PHT7_9RHOB|nr:acyl-CoA thioesterase [Wenxinia marina]KIQ70951.1 Thioesterase-like superfamily [Wenxinia marina DSM 24838]GGL56048.1 thioeseterase [Wenxinia marina]